MNWVRDYMESVTIPKYKVSIIVGIVAHKFIAIRGGSAMRISSFRRGDIVSQRLLRLQGRNILFNAIIRLSVSMPVDATR